MTTEWAIRASSIGPKETKIWAGNVTLSAGVQVSLQPSTERPSALELLLASWAGDVLEGFRRRLAKRGVDPYGLELSAKATLGNVLVHLGVVGEQGDPALERITATLYLSSDATREDAETALAEALALAPVHRTLEKAARIDLKLSIL